MILYWILSLLPVCIVVFLEKDRKKYLKKFGLVMVIGMIASLFPMLYIGLIFGFPAICFTATAVAYLFELKE